MLFAVWSLFVGFMNYTRVRLLPSPLSITIPLTRDQFSITGDRLTKLCGAERHALVSEGFPLQTGSHRDVTVIQKIEHKHDHDHGHPHARHPHIRGKIDVRDGSEARITLDITANSENMPFDVSFDDNQKLTITTPPVHPWSESYEPCLEVNAVVYLPKDSNLNLLSLHAMTLDISLGDKLGLGLNHAELGTVSGDVRVREGALAKGAVRLSSVSGDLEGDVPLAEVIHVETASGDISLNIVPVPDPKFSHTSLTVSSASGEIDVRAKGVPADISYEDKVNTVSGDITVVLPFSSAAVSTTSGEITASLIPIFADGKSLKTQSLSGQVKVTVHDPAVGGLDSLTSYHDTTSGDQKIRYPDAWEGQFEASSFSGDVSVKGKDVKVGGVRRGVKGGKGDGDSRLKANSFSGDIEVVIGEE